MGPTASGGYPIIELDLLNQFCLIGRDPDGPKGRPWEHAIINLRYTSLFSQDLIPPIYWQEP